MRTSFPAVVATLLLASNCKQGPDPADTIKKHRAAVEEVLENAEKVLAKARKEPPAADDDALPDDAPATGRSDDEVATEHIEALEKLEDEGAKSPPMDLDYADRLRGCAKIIRGNDTSKSAAFDVEKCAKAKYVLVLRIRDYRAPEKSGSKNFTPGEVSGDALLYRLKGAKKIGAFAFKATNSPKVAVAKTVAEYDLRKDLENALARALAGGGKSGKKSDDDE